MKGAKWVRAKRWAPAVAMGDLSSGLSVALVLVPQSLAYAELAGLPAHVGLFAAAFPAIAASLFASSPYLQTGPTAMASLLTVGAVSAVVVPDGQYAATAALLAILVGVARVLVGILRSGRLAYLLSQTVLTGFASGAAVLIIASQIPSMLGADTHLDGVLGGLASVAGRPGTWERESVLLTVGTAILMVGGRRLHPFFPGALLAAVFGVGWSIVAGYTGPRIGAVPTGFPRLALDLPWGSLPDLLVPALAIALVGFAEPAAIARNYAARDRVRWDPNREWLSQGIANIASGLFGGFPVGGSFSRSALARAAGARTRWSGAVAGLAVLAFLPFAWLLAPLPEAVLAAIVTTSVFGLLRPRVYPELWRRSHPQLGIAVFTLLLTLVFAPRVELGVLGGLGLAIAIHLWRELRIEVAEWEETGTLHLKPQGVLWFATAQDLWDRCVTLLAHHPQARRVVVHLDGLGRVDLSGMLALKGFVQDAQAGGIDVVIADVPPQTERLVRDVLGDED
ncbi:MAG: SulP family inorganic anion transporter [Chloroflexota bacterium]|nr:SulP family inorganic anion transporter [Chloroflexota bacterium]